MRLSDDCKRISRLGRRRWQKTADVRGLTEELRTSAGTQTLRTIQAAGLGELRKIGGLFVHGRVGVGKTLLAACSDTVVRQDKRHRTLVVTSGPAKELAQRIADLRLHWRISTAIKVVSYKFLGSVKRRDWLSRYDADLIVCDEAHALKDPEAVVTMRMGRYLESRPDCMFVAMTGSATADGDLEDVAHILYWCLRNRTPLPIDGHELRRWSRAIEGTGDSRVIFGAETQQEAMRIVRQLVHESPGCIVSSDAFTDVPLVIEPLVYDASEAMRPHYERLREFWEAPDGWSFGDNKFQVAACARQLANGFSYRLEPRPSEDFLRCRKRWANESRALVEEGFTDSEGGAKTLVRLGHGSKRALRALLEWERAEAAWPMRLVADWHDASTIRIVLDWIDEHDSQSIVWVKHLEFGEAVAAASKRLGYLDKRGKPLALTFYSGESGRDIRHADGKLPVIASIGANSERKNLQAFRHNLIVDPPANARAWEQLLGRTHREDQTKEVHAEYLVLCREHRQAIKKAIRGANKIEGIWSPQKLTEFYPPGLNDQDHPAWFQAVSSVDPDKRKAA